MVFLSRTFSDDIPSLRGNAAVYSSIILMLPPIFLLFYSKVTTIVSHILLHLFLLLLTKIMLNLCEFVEECRHIPSRYKNYSKALNASVHLKDYGCGIVIGALLCCLALESKNGEVDLTSLGWNIIISCFCHSLLNVSGFFDHTPAHISAITEKNKFNVAHGLAWSYYLGYLKLILPSLEEKVKEHQRTFESLPEFKRTWKLYILIPFSCKVYDKLEKVDSRIQFFDNLSEHHIDRAGIKKRSYKNSIYSIYDENKRPHHCILEYATPLQSLFEMSNDATASLSKERCLEQAKLFYVTLDNILNNSQECAGLFKLIPYDDQSVDRNMDSHFLSAKILKAMMQDRMEFAVPEENTWNNDSVVSDQTLMISKSNDPQPLQSKNY